MCAIERLTRKMFCYKALLVVFPIIVGIIYCSFYNSHFQWFLLAHIRIFLIEILPYWDWTHFAQKRCLLEDPYLQKQEEHRKFDYSFCWQCENVKNLTLFENLSKSEIQKAVNVLQTPLLSYNGTTTSSETINEKLIKLVDPKTWSPCQYESNVPQKHFPSWYYLHNNSSWFAQWQLCEQVDLKFSRKLYQKSSYFPMTLSCMGPNWLLLAANYKTKNYRTINTIDDWLWIIQISGESDIQLSVGACEKICDNLFITLTEGNIMLVPQGVYDLQYIPKLDRLNVAIAVECHNH